MRRLLVIGIGAGDPEHLTVQAIRALNEVGVFFLVDKGADTEDLAVARREICERFIDDPSYRIVELVDPPRDRAASAYVDAVDDWRARRARVWGETVRAELPDDGVGAFLVWGDPTLYDSTLDVIERIITSGLVTLEYEVIPGISSIQALTARHRITLTRVGGAVQVTTGRRLANEGWPRGVDDLVVMLDAQRWFLRIDPDGVEIFWGAYLGTADELLVAGPLATAGVEIERLRAAARQRKGWIMDTYLLRRCSHSGHGAPAACAGSS